MGRNIISKLFGKTAPQKSTYNAKYDFEADGIYYNIISIDDMTCKVTLGEVPYTGMVVIPQEVKYQDKTFNVTDISNTFAHNRKITGIVLPNTITRLKLFCFVGCYSLDEVKIADGDKPLVMENDAFCNAPLQKLHIGRDIAYTDREASDSQFSGSLLSTVTMGEGVTALNNAMFKNCTYLSSVTLPRGLKKIGRSAFKGCKSLPELDIPDNVTEIEDEAFANCEKMKQITFGENLSRLGRNVLKDCTSLDTIVCRCLQPPYIDEETFTNREYVKATLRIKSGMTERYKTNGYWTKFWKTEEE